MIETMKKNLILFILVVLPMLATAQYFGTNTHPMNKLTQNIDILKYWNRNTPEELKEQLLDCKGPFIIVS